MTDFDIDSAFGQSYLVKLRTNISNLEVELMNARERQAFVSLELELAQSLHEKLTGSRS